MARPGGPVPPVVQCQAYLLRLRVGSVGHAYPPLESLFRRMSQRRNDALIPEFWSAPKGLRSLQVAVRCPAARNRRDRTAPAAQTCVNAHSRRGSGSPATRRLSGSTRLNCRFDRAAAYRMRSTSGSAICAQPVVDLPAGRARVSGHRVRQVPVQSGLYRQRRHPREQPECVGRRAIPRGSARGCRHIPRPPPPPPRLPLVPDLSRTCVL
jgi:hypothetical protein